MTSVHFVLPETCTEVWYWSYNLLTSFVKGGSVKTVNPVNPLSLPANCQHSLLSYISAFTCEGEAVLNT